MHAGPHHCVYGRGGRGLRGPVGVGWGVTPERLQEPGTVLSAYSCTSVFTKRLYFWAIPPDLPRRIFSGLFSTLTHRQTDKQTNRQTYKTTTVTLAAHARRGLIILCTLNRVRRGSISSFHCHSLAHSTAHSSTHSTAFLLLLSFVYFRKEKQAKQRVIIIAVDGETRTGPVAKWEGSRERELCKI